MKIPSRYFTEVMEEIIAWLEPVMLALHPLRGRIGDVSSHIRSPISSYRIGAASSLILPNASQYRLAAAAKSLAASVRQN